MSAPADDGLRQRNRPSNSAFKQQKLPAWQPILTPKWVIGTFLTVAVVFVAIGALILSASNMVKEVTVDYSSCCNVSGGNGCNCTLNFNVPKTMKQPIYVYYQLDKFYQNHRRYVQSRSDTQLRGDFGGANDATQSASKASSDLTDCTPGNSKSFTLTNKDYYY